MGRSSTKDVGPRTPIALRRPAKGWRETFAGVTRANVGGQIVAGVTLLAIAIPEQLATSRLAEVPAFVALIAFITATLVFVIFGSNPILSVGADSTIAPLFAVALLRLAPIDSTLYFELVAVTAVVTGVVVAAIGLLKLGWIADFLSVPIVTGFLGGIGVVIIVHQLPDALGVASGGTSVIQRLESLSHVLGHVSGWSVALALGTLVVLLVGERLNARVPWALFAIAVATVLTGTLTLANHGVVELGAVSARWPSWRLHWLSAGQWGVAATTALTLVIVILSQTAATSRTTSDDLGVASDISRDFVGVGLANVAAGLVGAFPVNASPARSTVSRLAGGRTKLVGLTAAVLALALSPLSRFAHTIPLAGLAGVLFFIAMRLIKLGALARIWRTSRLEFLFAAVSGLGVILVGVEQGLAIAVGLAVLDQTWRAARPLVLVLGRRRRTTSWEPLGDEHVAPVEGVLVVLFDSALFFANAGVFRREIHELLTDNPGTRTLVINAAAMSDIDYTGQSILAEVLRDLTADHVAVIIARPNDGVRATLQRSFDPGVRALPCYDSVDEAVRAVTKDG